MNEAEQAEHSVAALSRRAEKIASRNRAGDLEELRIERIAIEGEIETHQRRLRQLESARREIDAEQQATETRLAEQRARLAARIDAIAMLERSALGAGK